MIKIFVYGTLREGMYNYNIYLKGRAKMLQKAYVKGELYQIEGVRYPALITGDDIIAGEIMELQDEQVLAEIDNMEGYRYAGHPENEYERICMAIYDANRKIIDHLPVYFYNDKNDTYKKRLKDKIQIGDYVAFMEQSKQ